LTDVRSVEQEGTTMPKQLLHEGRHFHLIPLRNSNGEVEVGEVCGVPDQPLNYTYGLGPSVAGSKGDGIIDSQEPSAFLSWSKSQDHDSGPGSEGYVVIGVELSERTIKELYQRITTWPDDVPRPERHWLDVGPLSWKDLNVVAKTARQARDDAFGKPE